MSVANGNPVFVTIGGDASSATVSTDGGKTSRNLATIAGVADQAASDAASAKTDAASAKSNSEAAVTAANSALTKANNAIPASTLGQPNGPAGLDGNGILQLNNGMNVGNTVSADWGIHWGNKSSGSEYHWHWNNTGQVAFQQQYWGGSSAGLNGNLAVWGAQISPAIANVMTLGNGALPWAGIYSQTALNVISDINEKDIVGTLGDPAYADKTTALRAIWEDISGVVYTLKSGHSGRQHFGVIAQTVEAAFKKHGLDASDYGLWCSTPLTVMEETQTNVLDENGAPKLDADGKDLVITSYKNVPVFEEDGVTQKTCQSVRYEELLCFGVFCERLNREAIEARLDALEAAAKKTV